MAAVKNGMVTEVGESKSFGNYVKYLTNDGYTIMYAHLNEVTVKKDDKIKQGDIVALSGNTGYSTGPHLHYTIWKNDEIIDPIKFLSLDIP